MNSYVKDLIQIKEIIDNVNNRSSYESDELIIQKINSLDKKIERMMNHFQRIERNGEESPVIEKRKREIISLLEKHEKLTSSQLSNLLGMSRTRCNEYLKNLEREGITKGKITDMKKFYKLIKWGG